MTHQPADYEGGTSRRGPLWWASVVLTLIGFAVSVYLTWIKLAGAYAVCLDIGDCESVNSSRFAEIGGIPIALIGAVGYLMILVVLLLELRLPEQTDFLRLTLFGFTLTGSLYSSYLTYLEVFVIHAVCPYCVLSAAAMISLFVISIFRLRSAFQSAA